VSKVGPDDVGRLLFGAAKHSKQLAVGLASLLVDPGGFVSVDPHLTVRELLIATQVANLAASELWLSGTWPEDFETLSSRWQKAGMRLFTEIRRSLTGHPPIGTEEVRKAIHVFECLPLIPELVLRDLKCLHKCLNANEEKWERWGLTRSPWKKEKRTPRRGNRLREHHQRIVAAIELLKLSKHATEQAALKIVSRLLAKYGVERTPDSLRKLCDRYQLAHAASRPGCRVSPDKLPEFWLDGRFVNSLGSRVLLYAGTQKITFRECLKRIAALDSLSRDLQSKC
jgi:hypothetical protein